MAEEAKSASFISLGLCEATFLVFLVLKLCHVIDWSWWYVTAPLWAPWAALIVGVVVVMLCAVVFGAVAYTFDAITWRPNRASRPSASISPAAIFIGKDTK
jgi:hypothetical protein